MIRIKFCCGSDKNLVLSVFLKTYFAPRFINLKPMPPKYPMKLKAFRKTKTTWSVSKNSMRRYIYIGFIIKADPNFWKPDEIKFRLFSDGTYEYYMLDRSVQKGKYTIDNGALFSWYLRSAFTRPFNPLVWRHPRWKIRLMRLMFFL